VKRNTNAFSSISALTCLVFATSLSQLGCGNSPSQLSDAQSRPPAASVPAAGPVKRPKLTIGPSDGSGQNAVLEVPARVSLRSWKAVLNGSDVTARFAQSGCGGGTCFRAALSAQQGLRAGKNLLYVSGVDVNGATVSARVRFGAPQRSSPSHAAAPTGRGADLTASAPSPTQSSFLPPALSFTTPGAGGAQSGQPWIQIGEMPLGGSCSTTYSVVVLDRSQLTPKSVPSGGCFTDGTTLKVYLATLGPDDLVVAGTSWGQPVDDYLDTTSIGGADYTAADYPGLSKGLFPSNYMIIGVGGAPASTAYESFEFAHPKFDPSATGMLVEDANGNYNFTPLNQGPLEYAVVPNDASYANTSTVRIYTVGTINLSKAGRVYSPPAPPSNSGGGLWLLTFQRRTMSEASGCASGAALGPIGPNDVAYPNCGTYYDTGNTTTATAASEAARLAADLASIPYRDLVVLTTVGNPFYVTTNGDLRNSSDIAWKVLPQQMVTSLASLGAPSHALQSLLAPGATFTLMSSRDTSFEQAPPAALPAPQRPNFMHSLNGDAVLSSNINSTQGQTGAVGGILLPDLRGLYSPTSTTQIDALGGSVDLSFHEMLSQPPTDWPELTTLLADSIEGQQAAYAYLSYQLIQNYYIREWGGDHVTDIHYFFTGSLAALLNVNTFDPTNVPPPSAGAGPYTWLDPTSGASRTFTQTDLQIVADSLQVELLALQHVLAFMSTGPGNLNDVITGGQDSVAFALISAAANIGASSIRPPQNTPTTLNYSDLSNFFGGVVSVATSIATALLPEEGGAVKIVGLLGGVISGTLWSGGSLGFTNPGQDTSAIPNANRNFLVTLGSIADGQVQGQLAASFDASLDLITSDYTKLLTTNIKVLDQSADGWYVPRSTGRAAASALMGYAAERSFYLGLLPAFYSMDVWLGFNSAGAIPDFGGQYGDGLSNCVEFYPYSSMPAYTSTGWPGAGSGKWDVYVMGGPITNGGSSSYQETLPGADLGTHLFTSSALNIPMMAVFDESGPLPVRYGAGFTGFGNNWCYPSQAQATGPGTDKGPSRPGDTSVTLSAPASVALGEAAALVAKTTAIGGSTKGATVLFLDGTQNVGSAVVDASGTATLTVPLALGSHSISVALVQFGNLNASKGNTVTVTVYPGAPDFALTGSTGAIDLTQETGSMDVQLLPKNGFAGSVKLLCAGLPDGYQCQFSPDSLAIDGSAQSTHLTIVAHH
jgi:hypothetical protein